MAQVRVLTSLIVFLSIPVLCYAAPTVGTFTVDLQENVTTPLTFNHTCESNSDAIILLVMVRDNATIDITSASYGNDNLIQDEEVYDSTSATLLAFFRGEEPETGSSLVVSISYTGGNILDFVTAAVCLTGDNTGFAIDATTAGTNGTGNPMSITVTSIAADTISFGAHFNNQSLGTRTTLVAGPTEINKDDVGGDTCGSAYRIATSAAGQVFAWTDTDDDEDWQNIAISYVEAEAAALVDASTVFDEVTLEEVTIQ